MKKFLIKSLLAISYLILQVGSLYGCYLAVDYLVTDMQTYLAIGLGIGLISTVSIKPVIRKLYLASGVVDSPEEAEKLAKMFFHTQPLAVMAYVGSFVAAIVAWPLTVLSWGLLGFLWYGMRKKLATATN